jgi:AraC-like DNA-binding protein
MTIFAPALGALWEQLKGYGIDPEPLFREEGIEPESMFDSGARIPLERYQRLDVKAAKLSGDPYFGLKGAEYCRPAHLGALGFAWLASSSLRTGFQRLSRYARVIQEKLTIDLDEDDEFFYVRMDAHMPLLNKRIRENGQLAAVTRFCRMIAGEDFNPARILMKQPEPEDSGFYYELFRCAIDFDCDSTTFVVRLEDVDRRLTGSNDQLAKLNEHIVVKYLAHNEKQDIVNRVKAAIIDRKLQKEDTSFKQLLTEVRKELAQQYIQDRSKTLTEISFMLGFSEVSSFSRAFKGWTGKPPSEVRQGVA